MVVATIPQTDRLGTIHSWAQARLSGLIRAALLPVSPSSSNDLSSAGNPDPLQCCVKQHLNAVAREVRVYLREFFTAQKPTKGI